QKRPRQRSTHSRLARFFSPRPPCPPSPWALRKGPPALTKKNCRYAGGTPSGRDMILPPWGAITTCRLSTRLGSRDNCTQVHTTCRRSGDKNCGDDWKPSTLVLALAGVGLLGFCRLHLAAGLT